MRSKKTPKFSSIFQPVYEKEIKEEKRLKDAYDKLDDHMNFLAEKVGFEMKGDEMLDTKKNKRSPIFHYTNRLFRLATVLEAHAKANDYLINDYHDCTSIEWIQKL
jgi:hypothetical protein